MAVAGFSAKAALRRLLAARPSTETIKPVPPMWVYGVPEKRRDFEKRFGAQAFASRSSAVTRLLA
jgi:hypothetical protein